MFNIDKMRIFEDNQLRLRIEKASSVELICILYEEILSRLLKARILLKSRKLPSISMDDIIEETKKIESIVECEDSCNLSEVLERARTLSDEIEILRQYTKLLNSVIQIISGLKSVMANSDENDEITSGLNFAYDYCVACVGDILEEKDEGKFDQVIHVLKTIKGAWDDVAKQYVKS